MRTPVDALYDVLAIPLPVAPVDPVAPCGPTATPASIVVLSDRVIINDLKRL